MVNRDATLMISAGQTSIINMRALQSVVIIQIYTA